MNVASSYSSPSRGGGLYCRSIDRVEQTEFELNQATTTGSDGLGGALYCEDFTSGSVVASSFSRNSVSGNSPSGGAAYFERGISLIEACVFLSNYASGQTDARGGACYGHVTSFVNCTFGSNYATTPASSASGGALFLDSSYAAVNFGIGSALSNCRFTNNLADGSVTQGGAIYRPYYELRCTDCEFSGNSAQRGGGISWQSGNSVVPIAFTRCTFQKNTGSDGAAIYANSARRFEMIGCSLSMNLAFSEGGALWLRGYCLSNSQITGTTFFGNIASTGGAVSIGSNACSWNLPISNCLFASNTAISGGGIYNRDGGSSNPSISGTTFCGNDPQAVQGSWQDNGGNVSGAGTDCNANGVCDIDELAVLDCDSNGTLDSCELATGAADDCNGNGVIDACDIASGAADANVNGVPDTCEFARGDFDLDGTVGGGDLAILLSFWGDPNGSVADLSGDGAVTAEDLALLLSLWGG